jgi:hypothetical protein
MNLEEFRGHLVESVRSSAEANQDFIRASFVDEVGLRLSEAEEFTDFEPCRFEGLSAKKRKLQIDGYSFDDADNSLALLIVDYSNEDEMPTIGATDTRNYFRMLRGFVEEALHGNVTDGSIEESQPGYGLASDLIVWRPSISRFRFYFATDAQLKTTVKDWPEENIDDIPTEFHIWDIARFHNAHESATGRDDLAVDFRQFGCEGLPCIRAGKSAGDYEAYLCMIPGDVLADIYDQHGSRLLEGNVRSFLSSKGKVNTRILVTIRNQPEMFFAYNNGIAATAEDVVLDQNESGLFIAEVKNLQIVNGGQTTASLALAKRKDGADLSKVSVQMKLSVLPAEKAGTLIPEIARFANSQNKVSDADFFANHPYHIRLEDFSRRLYTAPVGGAQHGTHWFYERARGQYLNEQARLTPSQKKQFQLQNPKSQLLSKTDVAKLVNTWRELPYKVSLGAQKNFMFFADVVAKEWAEDEKKFHEEYFRQIVALAILFRQTEAMVSDQAWYQGGYRANIVTYSLAKLHEMIAEQALGLQFNFQAIWERQSVPPPVVSQLVRIAKSVFDVLTDPDRPKDNVTEWAKMQACWDRVKAADIVLSSSVKEQLLDVRTTNAAQKKAKQTQETDNGIAMQIAVIEIPGSQWAKLRSWGEERKLLTSKDSELLRLASMIPSRMPNERQCLQIWQLHSKLIDEGYGKS